MVILPKFFGEASQMVFEIPLRILGKPPNHKSSSRELIALLKPAIYVKTNPRQSYSVHTSQIDFSLEDVGNMSFNRIFESFGATAGVTPESRPPLVRSEEICEDLFDNLSVI